MNLQQGNIFTPVCHSVHGGRYLPQCKLGYISPWADTPLADTPPGQTPLGRHPQADTPRQTPTTPGKTPPGQTPPLGRHPPWADTHPGQTPPGQTHPLSRHTPLGRHTPPPPTPGGHCSGRYASLWHRACFSHLIMDIYNSFHNRHNLCEIRPLVFPQNK